MWILIIIVDCFIPAIPDAPQVTAEYPVGSCELNISITAPDNIAINDISHFVIYIDGVNVKNDTSLSLLYSVSSCATHNVSVAAVNRCDRESSPAMDTVVPGQVCVCDSGSANAAMDNSKYTIMCFIPCYLCVYLIFKFKCSRCYCGRCGGTNCWPGYCGNYCDYRTYLQILQTVAKGKGT